MTTVDGIKKKSGDRVWEIGISKDGYRPTRSIVNGIANRVVNPDRTWNDYNQCLSECDKLNAERLKK